MKFGIILPVEGNVTEGGPNPKLALKAAERAEEMGYDSVWAGERLLLSQRLDPIAILSSVASRTERVRLGTAAMVAPLKHPVVLANQLTTLDNVSNGRLIAGFGVGAERIRAEYDAVGVPFSERGARLRECIAILRQIWTSQDVTFDGKYYHLKNLNMMLRPRQKGGPPIWLGGMKRGLLQRVAKLAEGWMPSEAIPAEYAAGFEEISSCATALGRKNGDSSSRIERGLYITLNIKDDPEKARNEAKRFLETYYNVIFPSIEKAGFFGTLKDCIGRFEEYSSVGVETVIVRFASFDDQLKEIEYFHKEIAPSFS